MLVTEMWMDRVARMTDQPLQNIRQLNLYKEKDRTHFGQILHGSQIQVAPCFTPSLPLPLLEHTRGQTFYSLYELGQGLNHSLTASGRLSEAIA